MPWVAEVVGCGQYGSGINGGGTAFAHLHVRLFFAYCLSRNLSGGTLFVDVVTAFAVILRRIRVTKLGSGVCRIPALGRMPSGTLFILFLVFMISIMVPPHPPLINPSCILNMTAHCSLVSFLLGLSPPKGDAWLV